MLTLALTGDGPDALSQLFNVNPLDHKSRVYPGSVYGRFKNEGTKLDVEMRLNFSQLLRETLAMVGADYVSHIVDGRIQLRIYPKEPHRSHGILVIPDLFILLFLLLIESLCQAVAFLRCDAPARSK